MVAAVTLEALEARFAELQRKVLGDDVSTGRRTENETVVDLLADASVSLRAALSGRDKAASVVPRMAELDRYLDPTFEDSLDVSALVEAAVSSGPDLAECGRRLERLSQLSPALDSEAIAGVAGHRERIERLALANLEMRELSDECCARVYALVDEYNAVVANITKTLVQLDDTVTQLELESRPKKVVE